MVVPTPARLVTTDGAPFRLDGAGAKGDTDAVATLAELVHTRTGLTLGESADHDRAIELTVSGDGAPESYSLRVTGDRVTITGADEAGLFYGIHTLSQLIETDAGTWQFPAVEIDDAPRFTYRGVMLDVARHFHGVDSVKGYIDRAAALKFNHLHLHLSDDQGWRLAITSRPELTEKASAFTVSGAEGGFFTQDDYREIVAYAARHHMTVVPEFDMPGHTHAISAVYPELIGEPVITDHMRDIVRDYGGELPQHGTVYQGMAVGFSSFQVHDEATYDFIADVFGELAALTPGPYLHFGGDECLGTSRDDFDHFVRRVSRLIQGLGKTPIAWHEAGDVEGLAPGTIGQYWGYVSPIDGMDEKARGFVRNGGKVILSPADAIYLDMKHSEDSPLGLIWANGVTSLKDAYDWEPTDLIEGLTENDILGVEACLWSETIRAAGDIDEMAFPRIAGAADAAWSPAAARSRESLPERIAALAPLWDAQGIGYFRSPEVPWP